MISLKDQQSKGILISENPNPIIGLRYSSTKSNVLKMHPNSKNLEEEAKKEGESYLYYL